MYWTWSAISWCASQLYLNSNRRNEAYFLIKGKWIDEFWFGIKQFSNDFWTLSFSDCWMNFERFPKQFSHRLSKMLWAEAHVQCLHALKINRQNHRLSARTDCLTNLHRCYCPCTTPTHSEHLHHFWRIFQPPGIAVKWKISDILFNFIFGVLVIYFLQIVFSVLFLIIAIDGKSFLPSLSARRISFCG